MITAILVTGLVVVLFCVWVLIEALGTMAALRRAADLYVKNHPADLPSRTGKL